MIDVINHNIKKITFLLVCIFLQLSFLANAQNFCENANAGIGYYQGIANYLGVQANNDCSVNISFGTSLGLTPVCYNTTTEPSPFEESCQNSMIFCFNKCYHYRLFLDEVEVAEVCTDSDEYTFQGVPWSSGEYKVTIEYRDVGVCEGVPTCLVIVETRTVDFTGTSDCFSIVNFHNQNLPAYVHKGEDVMLNCTLQDGRQSDVKSSTAIYLNAGFYSGAGTNTIFEAYIAECPPMRVALVDDDTRDSDVILDEEKEQLKEVEEAMVSEIEVFPNPTSGSLIIHVPNDINITNFRLFNLMGQEVKVANFEQNVQVDLSELENGVYVLIINTDLSSFERRVVLSR